MSTPKQEPASSLQALLALLPLMKRSNADVFEWLLAMEAAVAQPSEPEPEGVPPTADLEWNEDYNDAKIREPEPARDVLTAVERESVEMLRAGYGAREEIVAIIDRLAPKPAPVSPLQALLAEMRLSGPGSWSDKLSAAMAAEKARHHG